MIYLCTKSSFQRRGNRFTADY